MRPAVAVAVIIKKAGRVLLGERINPTGQDCWQFPGGHLEFGESVEACARREVLEENGLQIDNLRIGPYCNDVFLPANTQYITLFVIADWRSGQPEALERDKCRRWDWFMWSNLPQPLFQPTLTLLQQGFNLDDFA
ncbi:MAG: NUDIX domain-containing protein [Gammaproteobacteria bacterium]|nr:NUDIX domain-containing protein [Gammaproteobacteria bacterium]